MAKAKKATTKSKAPSKAALAHYYKHFRQHQQNVIVKGGGMLTTFPSGRTELSYASSAYGCHALSAWQSAKWHSRSMDRYGR